MVDESRMMMFEYYSAASKYTPVSDIVRSTSQMSDFKSDILAEYQI